MSQTLSASTLLAVPLAPLAGAALAGIFGTVFGGNLIGRRVSHSLTILGVFVAFSHYLGDMHGQVFVFFILTVAAAESAIGLAILVLLFRNRSSISVEELNTLKG